MTNHILIIFLVVVLYLASCKPSTSSSDTFDTVQENIFAPYNLNSPDTVFLLPKSLKEISGLAYSKTSSMLLTHNDEKGDLYFLDPINGTVDKKINFGKSDDYEGITTNRDKIYIVESNGNVKVVSSQTENKIKEYDGVLNSKNNIEGLAYFPPNQTLLLAAKGNNKLNGNDKNQKSIFQMNTSNGKISPQPFLSIKINDLLNNLAQKDLNKNSTNYKTKSSRIKKIAPSGLAIHPTTNDLFILSSSGKLLVIYSQTGELKALEFLNHSVHRQPEGICFDISGNLYIANEGRGKRGSISKYQKLDPVSLRF